MRRVILLLLILGIGFSDMTVHAAVFTRPLDRGVWHEQVGILQQFLYMLQDFYPEGLVTNYFGPLTERGVQRFQSFHKIVDSGTPATTGYGRVGPQTREKLNEVYDAEIASSQAPRNDVEEFPVLEQIPPMEPIVSEEMVVELEQAPAPVAEVLDCREERVPSEYPTIQEALDAVCAGGSVLVSAGDYDEHLIIATSSVILIRDGEGVATIRANKTSVIKIDPMVRDVLIEGFSLRGDYTNIGILMQEGDGQQRITIRNNDIRNMASGVSVNADEGIVTVERNLLLNNRDFGIYDAVHGSGVSYVYHNTMHTNGTGYYLDAVNGSHIVKNNSISSSRKDGVAISSTGTEQEEDILLFSYNNVWNSFENNYYSYRNDVAFEPPGVSNVAVDPKFSAEYIPAKTSILVNSGDPSLPTDPDGTRADIGARFYDHRLDQTASVYTATQQHWLIGTLLQFFRSLVSYGH